MSAINSQTIDIVFDGPPGPEAGRFVEVESPPGTSISFGEWVKRDDGYWALRFTKSAGPEERDAVLEEAAKICEDTENEEASGGSMNTYYAQLGDASATRYKCAENIRALKRSSATDSATEIARERDKWV